MDYPKLRPIEAVPAGTDGQRSLILRDPHRLSESVLLVPMVMVPILRRFDGGHSLGDIRAACRSEHRLEVPMEKLREIVSQFEAAHFLEGEEFEAWRKSLESEFLSAPTRPGFLAGKSYEEEPESLRSQIEGFFTHEKGPGLPDRNGGAPREPLRGVVAPHIDFQRGGPSFAWSYRAVAERADADLFIVLGTVHVPTRGMYCLTRKPFETPFGPLEVDLEFTDRLAEAAPEDLFQDEFAQRAEHSIEFQAVLLRYIYREKRPVKFVPVLVGSFGEFVKGGVSPSGSGRVEGFIGALRGTIKENEAAGKKVCLLASVDFAHVGPQFGGGEAVDAQKRADVEQQDRASIDAVCRGDAEGFYWSVAADGDRRNVCGLAPIYTMLRSLDGLQGELLDYSQWPDPNGTVSFCSLALH